MKIIETPVFTRKIRELLPDNGYRKLQWVLALNPEAGSIMPGCSGLRKLRWAVPGKGKRGGLRIIYYWYSRYTQKYMLFVYKKSRQEDLTKAQLKILMQHVKEGVI